MEKQPLVLNFPDFTSRHEAHVRFLKEGFAIRQISTATWSGRPESFTRVHSILFVYEGSMNVKFDGQNHRIPRNGFSDVIDLIPLEITAISHDLRAYHLLFTENFLANLIKNRPPFPFSYMLEMSEKPVRIISESDRATYMKRLSIIEDVMREPSHHFRTEMLKSALWMFLLDVSNIYLHQEESRSENLGTDHLRNIFLRFMQLLPKHVREEHTVGFYASQLCITPQYLNRVVRQISGQSVSEAINRMLTGEIAKLLDDKDLTIQEIADRLCFADQATMSKFFKRQKGLSPTAYRQNGSCSH